MRQLTAVCCTLLMFAPVRPALAQRWRDTPAGEGEFAWAGGLVFGALAAAGTHNASPGIRGFSVGVGISVGTGLGVSLGHHLYNRPAQASVVWPVIGAGVVALPLTMTGDCSKRHGSCGWDVIIVPLVSALGALIAHQLSQR